MNKKQSLFRKLDSPVYFLTVLMVSITVIFIIFTPRVSSSIFPIKRDMVFNSFLKDTKSTNSIDPQEYWKFREFYSPGYFELIDQGLEDSEVKSALEDIGIKPDNVDLYFSRFYSKHLISLDGLTRQSTLSAIANSNARDILFENKNSIIFKNNENKTVILFLLPISEMKKANGFFEYDGKDKELLKDKNWFNITLIDR